MSLLVVGLSHRSSPIHLLERAALDADGARRLAALAIAPAPVATPAGAVAPTPSATESLGRAETRMSPSNTSSA